MVQVQTPSKLSTIQIQPMLRLNWGINIISCSSLGHSNTTNVKVKPTIVQTYYVTGTNSNTTNVKVKPANNARRPVPSRNSNTTNVKVKLTALALAVYKFTAIQIQPMLRLNDGVQRRGHKSLWIQIQPMLRLNYHPTPAVYPGHEIQIQPMLRLNEYPKPLIAPLLANSNTTNVKVKHSISVFCVV